MSAAEQSPPSKRHLAYPAAAFVLLASWSVDRAILGYWSLETLAVRLLWSGALVACGLVDRSRPGSRHSPRIAGVAGILSTAGFLYVSALTGGTDSLYFPMTLFMPILISQVEPEWVVPMRVTTAVVLLGGLAIILAEGGSLYLLAGWTMASAFMGWWAVHWFTRVKRHLDAEREAERKRAEAEQATARATAELARAEQRRAQSERLAAVGRLATGVAHEINTPLSYIRSNLDFLARALENHPDPELRGAAQDSLAGVDRIAEIVRDLRGFSRATEDPLELMDTRQAIDEAVRLASVRLRGSASLVTDIAPGLPAIQCRRGRLVQILVNLLVNAVEAIEQAPQKLDEPLVVLGARVVEGSVLLWVEDSGPGVPEEVARNLFQPFVSTKPRGAGLGMGLALSREFVEGLGGTLRLCRGTLPGARFELELPLRPRAEASTA